MAAGYQELILEQGATFNTTITIDDVTGASYNLYNFTASAQMRKSYGSANAAATFSASIINPTNGIILLSLNANQTSNIASGRYLYDIKLSDNHDAANNTIRILEGMVTVSAQVTR